MVDEGKKLREQVNLIATYKIRLWCQLMRSYLMKDRRSCIRSRERRVGEQWKGTRWIVDERTWCLSVERGVLRVAAGCVCLERDREGRSVGSGRIDSRGSSGCRSVDCGGRGWEDRICDVRIQREEANWLSNSSFELNWTWNHLQWARCPFIQVYRGLNDPNLRIKCKLNSKILH